MKKQKIFIAIIITFIILSIILMYNFNIIPKKSYLAKDFNIKIIYNNTDKDQDGIIDYEDILQGAKLEAKNNPRYVSKYYQGGYPPASEGVCTDVIWRAFKNAGYELKDMVDKDIINNIEKYLAINKPDPNIDFRRVRNLKVFFDNNYTNLTNDPYIIEEWMPGDIVIFDTNHIAIISDKRNKEGIPYIIHNAGQPNKDEDSFIYWYKTKGISGHYRI